MPAILLLWVVGGLGQSPPQTQQQTQEKKSPEDPFSGIPVKASPQPPTPQPDRRPWIKTLVTENFGFRKEVMSQFNTNEDGRGASRQSVGFELLKKFSTETATVASFNFQARLVRRDGFNPMQNDVEGEHRPGWAFEYHNLYLDFYNILNPLLNDRQKGENVGRFNFRAGRFYLPFGLNLQTDTHGTVLQLSNDRNFGFERDWYTGFWGTLNRHLNYDAYYAIGSGYDINFQGQRGLGALRISLANQYSSRYGLEGGVSILGGERLSMDREMPGPIDTRRAGLDGRYRRPVPAGLLTLSNELTGGRDARNSVFTQLHQAEYTHASRRWGLATQYRRFWEAGAGADSSLLGEFSWYFRNDVGNSNLHWIKLNVERRLERSRPEPPSTVVTLQYYFYR